MSIYYIDHSIHLKKLISYAAHIMITIYKYEILTVYYKYTNYNYLPTHEITSYN